MRLATPSLPISQNSRINPIPHKILNLPFNTALKNIQIILIGLESLIEAVSNDGFGSQLFYFVALDVED